MPVMPCDEYKKLNLLHESVKYRLKLYDNPKEEPNSNEEPVLRRLSKGQLVRALEVRAYP